jgi:16S rRNA (adenine1518-N6/adenine1519-N6)-dimethyltransferase
MERGEKTNDYERVKELVISAFRSRRKRLVNNLPEALRGRAPEALRSLGYLPDARAEELTPGDFTTLSHLLSELV